MMDFRGASPTTDGTGTAPGWFGKIASLGDFARRRLPEDTAAAFDTWLARGVEASRAQLGERWLNVYLTSPLWRFALAPGCLDSRWWFGLMMPSCDNVGRYFPLLIAHPCAEPPRDGAGLAALEAWFGGVANAAMGTLQAGASVDRFEADLARIGLPPAGAPLPSWPAAQFADRARHEFNAGIELAPYLQNFSAAQTLQRLRGCSLWWSLRPGSAASSVSIAVGLPPGDAFSQMLEGTW